MNLSARHIPAKIERMTANSPHTTRARWWPQFGLRQAFVLLTLVLVIGGWIKGQIDFRAAKARFYDAIQENNLSEVQSLLRVYPTLIRSRSPLIRVGSDISIYSASETPVWVAVNSESRDVFSYLMTLQPDVNGVGEFGPPIITAALRKDTYYLRLLLAHGADPSVRDFMGRTALALARQYGMDESASLLAMHHPPSLSVNIHVPMNVHAR